MAADDDLDALEAQLEDYDDDEDDDDLPPIKLLWKKYRLIIVPLAAFLIFIPVVLMSTGGSDDGEIKLVIVPELAPEPGKQIKMMPEQPGGEQIPGQEKGVFNVVTEGKNKGKIVIAAPPEDPKSPPTGGKAADGAETPIAMAPEGAQKTPGDATAAEGSIMPPPTPPDGDGVAALPPPPAPGDGKMAENILPAADGEPVPGDEKAAENILPVPAADEKTPDKTVEVAVLPIPTATPTPTPTPTKVPANSNQIAVVIPKAPANTVALPPSPPAGNTDFTPMRTMAGVYRVQVASTRSESAAKMLWDKQVNKHPDVLGQLPLTVQLAVIKDRGTFYRVQGGAFGDREAADTVCRKLKSRGQDCIVVRP